MDLSLYAVTVFLWGTSWLAIKLQLGVVAPEVSVVYRFVIAAVIMLAFCLLRRRPMRFKTMDHVFLAMQGVFLFSTNYFFIYLGSQYLTSGLVAVAFSSIVVMNILGSALLFRSPLSIAVAAGSVMGLAGMIAVFWPEVRGFELAGEGARADQADACDRGKGRCKGERTFTEHPAVSDQTRV